MFTTLYACISGIGGCEEHRVRVQHYVYSAKIHQ